MNTIDLHVDYPWQCFRASAALDLNGSTMLQCDFPRMDKGGLATFVAALYISDKQQDALGVDKSWNAIKNQIRTASTARTLLALEGGRLFDKSEQKLAELADAGVTYLTLTHNFNTDWADSATDRMAHNGLTAVGKRLVKAIEKANIIVDVSHTSEETTDDVLEIATRPVIASHSGVRSLIDHPRNLYDFQIRRIVETGGLIGIPYATRFVGSKDGVVEAIHHIANLVGDCDHIAVGSDLDGADTVIEDVSEWSEVLEPLTDLGYSVDDLEKIKGGNFWRLVKHG